MMRNVRQRQPEKIGEKDINDDFYSITNGGRKGEDGMKPLNFTAFRRGERYFRSYPTLPEGPNSFDLIDYNISNKKGLIPFLEIKDGPMIYELESHPGVLYIPEFLGKKEQIYWIKKCVFEYLGNENPTSLSAHWDIGGDHLSIGKLFKEGKKKIIKRIPYIDDSEKVKNSPLEQEFSKDCFKSLFRKMRWSTLGYRYNWTTKEYHHVNSDMMATPPPFPQDLASLASTIASLISPILYVAEAGIVNQYQEGDTLCGHIDRSEPNMSSPLVSISLGSHCIFVIGGEDRECIPSGILLKSGDVIILTGKARKYYHGVAKIIKKSNNDEDYHLDEDSKIALDLLGNGRININIRQVNN